MRKILTVSFQETNILTLLTSISSQVCGEFIRNSLGCGSECNRGRTLRVCVRTQRRKFRRTVTEGFGRNLRRTDGSRFVQGGRSRRDTELVRHQRLKLYTVFPFKGVSSHIQGESDRGGRGWILGLWTSLKLFKNYLVIQSFTYMLIKPINFENAPGSLPTILTSQETSKGPTRKTQTFTRVRSDH